MAIVGAVVVPCRCHGCCHYTMCGAVVMVVHCGGVMVAVILLHMMLQLWWLALNKEEGRVSVSKGGGR